MRGVHRVRMANRVEWTHRAFELATVYARGMLCGSETQSSVCFSSRGVGGMLRLLNNAAKEEEPVA